MNQEIKEDNTNNIQRSDRKRRTIASIRYHLCNDLQVQGEEILNRLSVQPRKVLILNTGGTISMFPSSKGLITQKGALVNFLKNNPYSCDLDYTFFQSTDGFLITPQTSYQRRIWYKVEELDKLIDSSNMAPTDWITIATEIEKRYQQYDSFIIAHGTDTMAYTASALSFMFQNLSKTVIITGSQVPLSQPRNDGFTNLLNSLTVAGHFTIPEVLICFNDKLLRGNRSQKVNSVSLDSFDSPKFSHLGTFGVQINIKWDLILQNNNRSDPKLYVKKSFCDQVNAIRLNPLMNHKNLHDIFQNQKLRGLVIETYGSGNMQTNPEFYEEIKQAKEKGVIIVNISQCHKSYLEMLYETGILFSKIGVIAGADMTTEAAVTKLSYLLGQEDLTNEDIKNQFQTNLRGELTPPSLQNAQSEPFLVALSSAIKSQTDNADINRDLVFPNILCQLCLQKKPLSSIDISKFEINYAATDYDKRTVLHVAAREGSVDIVELILKEAPEIVDFTDRWNHSPMYEAVVSRHFDIIHILNRYGGNLIAPLNELTNILNKAIEKKDMEMFELFFQAGIRDFGQYRTLDNRTLAHVAMSFGNNEVLQFLRKGGIMLDWNQKDKFGRTAYDEMKYQKRKLK